MNELSVISSLAEISQFTRFEQKTIAPELILSLLETAVWAPNDGLREPWRFLFIDGEQGKQALPLHHAAPAHLVVIAKAAGDLHKQAEDLAAVYCLIQNVRLLGLERQIGINVFVEEWMYDHVLQQSLGIRDKERIAAILDIGYVAAGAANGQERYPALRISEC
jgi:hypothetical protein